MTRVLLSNKEYFPAGLRVRSLAFGLDYLPIALYLILLFVVAVVANRVWQPVVNRLFGDPISGEVSGFVLITLPISLYFAVSEASSSRATWGKRKMHLQVTDLTGGRVSPTRSLGRTALKFIPWELAHACIWQISFAADKSLPIYTAGFAIVWLLAAANVISLLISPNHETLYDWASGTLVVAASGRSLHHQIL